MFRILDIFLYFGKNAQVDKQMVIVFNCTMDIQWESFGDSFDFYLLLVSHGLSSSRN